MPENNNENFNIENIINKMASEYGDVLKALAAGPGEETKFDEGFKELCDKIDAN